MSVASINHGSGGLLQNTNKQKQTLDTHAGQWTVVETVWLCAARERRVLGIACVSCGVGVVLTP